jgi:hypothetical protein
MRFGAVTSLLAVTLMLSACDGDNGGSTAALGSTNWVRHWNEIAINASGLDHTPVAPGETRVFGENYGPTRASHAMAIAHIAMFEAVNAIAGGYESYVGLQSESRPASMKAAIAQAAHDTLVALFPSQAATFEGHLAVDLSKIADGEQKKNGIDLGRRAAAAILTLRESG